MSQEIGKDAAKKLIALLLSTSLITGSLSGCGGNINSSASENNTDFSKSDISSSSVNIIPDRDIPDDFFEGPHDPVTIIFPSGFSKGSTYHVADAAANLWNKEIDYIKITNEESSGNLDNLKMLHDGNAQVTLVDADYCYQCLNGTGQFIGNDNPTYPELKVIAGLWLNLNQVIVNKQSNITMLKDIKGKRFAVGENGSAVYYNCDQHLAAVNLTHSDFESQEIALWEATDEVFSGKIDGSWMLAPIPTRTVEAAYQSNCELLDISSDIVDTLKEDYPWYAAYTIPANTYPGQYQDVETSGIKVLLVCRGDLDDRTVYDLTRSFWINIAPLATSLAADNNHNLDNLTAMNAVKDIAGLPLHPGAERYYEEVGAL